MKQQKNTIINTWLTLVDTPVDLRVSPGSEVLRRELVIFLNYSFEGNMLGGPWKLHEPQPGSWLCSFPETCFSTT